MQEAFRKICDRARASLTGGDDFSEPDFSGICAGMMFRVPDPVGKPDWDEVKARVVAECLRTVPEDYLHNLLYPPGYEADDAWKLDKNKKPKDGKKDNKPQRCCRCNHCV